MKFRLASFLAWGTAEFGEAERVCRTAQELFEAAGDRRGVWLATLELSSFSVAAGELSVWPPVGTRVAQAAEAAGDPFVVMQALGRGVAWGSLFLGDFEAADAAIHRSITLARDAGRTYFHALSLTALGISRALEGQLAAAYPVLAEAKTVNPDWRDGLQLEYEILVHWLAGDYESALAQAQESVTWNSAGVAWRRALFSGSPRWRRRRPTASPRPGATSGSSTPASETAPGPSAPTSTATPVRSWDGGAESGPKP